jgi:hypothetical protein
MDRFPDEGFAEQEEEDRLIRWSEGRKAWSVDSDIRPGICRVPLPCRRLPMHNKCPLAWPVGANFTLDPEAALIGPLRRRIRGVPTVTN